MNTTKTLRSKEGQAYQKFLAGKAQRAKINRRPVKMEVVKFDKNKAARLLKKNWDRQRPQSKAKVNAYESDMKNDNFCFSLATIDIAVHRLGEFEYLFNGQHTLRAIHDYLVNNVVEDEDYPQVLVRTHTVESEDEVGYLYSRIDIGRMRNFAHRVGATDVSELLGRHKLVNAVSGGISNILKGFRNVGSHIPYTKNEIVIEEMVRQYEASIKTFLTFYNGCEVKEFKHFLSKSAVIGVMLLVLDQAPDEADEFLETLTSTELGDDLGTLKRAIMTGHFKENRRENYVSRVLAKFWNAHYKSKALKNMPNLKEDEINKPIQLLGTSFNGKR